MISQKCPKCLSSRVRRGYRPTPFWLKIFFRYNLLCDNCNWEFTGFAVPGTVSAKPTRNPKKKPVAKTAEEPIINSNKLVQPLPEESTNTQIQIDDSLIEKFTNGAETAVEENSNNTETAVEEVGAVEKSIDTPVSLSVGKSKKKAKRKSGV